MIIISYLYITENGASLKTDGGYYVIVHKDGELTKIPKETLEYCALFGNVSVTTPCIKEFLKKGIPVSYFSSYGTYYGRLESTSHRNVFRLKKQIFLSENKDFTLDLCRKIISAKINNQIVLLNRYSNNVDVSEEINYMKISRAKIKTALTKSEIMGYEGTAARYYFSGLSKLINPDFSFKGRNRMPPRDPFNSMLSLGYTILMYEIYGFLESKSLSPYCGFLHSDNESHPTLASDLMEEWRAVIVDSTVLSLIQGNEINVNDFTRDIDTSGVFLNQNAMHTFIKKYEKKLRQNINYLESSAQSYRNCIQSQVDLFVKAVENQDSSIYEPVKIR